MNHGIDTSFLVAAELHEHDSHGAVRNLISTTVSQGDRFSLAPQVLAEFVHVTTDQKRFERPLAFDKANEIAMNWWSAEEIDRVYPNGESVERFFIWMKLHQLGRKRLLDTMLAATYWQAGIRSIATLNPADFLLFAGLSALTPSGS